MILAIGINSDYFLLFRKEVGQYSYFDSWLVGRALQRQSVENRMQTTYKN